MAFFSSKTLPDPDAAAEALAADLARWLLATPGIVRIALSGGRTPERLFAVLAGRQFRDLPWRRLQIFWVDERWVPYDSPDSNFGNAWRLLFNPVGFPMAALHPMLGLTAGATVPVAAGQPGNASWNDVTAAATGYSRLLQTTLPAADGIPVFDLVLLGMGTDGHTASLFPGAKLETPQAFCSATRHPATGTPRLTLTPAVLNHARQVIFLVTGADKAAAFQAVRNGMDLPAAGIAPVSGPAAWYLDAAVEA
jgi:6-phosphogluconolactonase